MNDTMKVMSARTALNLISIKAEKFAKEQPELDFAFNMLMEMADKEMERLDK